MWLFILIVYLLIGLFLSYAIENNMDILWLLGWPIIIISIIIVLPFIGAMKLGETIYRIIHNK